MGNVLSRNEIEARLQDQAPVFEVGSAFVAYDFSAMDLSHATFRKCVFLDCNLYGANLEEADLAEAEFYNCSLDRVTAKGANLTKAIVESSRIPDSVFSEASLGSARFVQCDLMGSDFSGALMSYARFHTCLISHRHHQTLFSQVEGTGLGFELCDMEMVDFEFSKPSLPKFLKCDLEKAGFDRCEMEGAVFERSSLEGATFCRARLRGCIFPYADLRDSKWSRMQAKLCSVEDANITGISTTGSDLEDCRGFE